MAMHDYPKDGSNKKRKNDWEKYDPKKIIRQAKTRKKRISRLNTRKTIHSSHAQALRRKKDIVLGNMKSHAHRQALPGIPAPGSTERESGRQERADPKDAKRK